MQFLDLKYKPICDLALWPLLQLIRYGNANALPLNSCSTITIIIAVPLTLYPFGRGQNDLLV